MTVIPVLDLLGGIVVHGVAGVRERYRPIESQLAPGCDPLDIARGFRKQLGLQRLYVADLDGILHGRPNLDRLGALAADGFELMVDAGLRDDLTAARDLIDAGATELVLGLETCAGPEFCASLVREFSPERIVFSLDLKGGEPLRKLVSWGNSNPIGIAERAIAAGVQRMIVLDVAQVGVGEGVATKDLCCEIKQQWPAVEVITGGGVRGSDDLAEIQSWSVDGVLVATALHRGRIDRAALAH